MASVHARSEIAEQLKWDTTSIYPSDEAWEAALAQVRAALPHVESYAGQLSGGPQRVADWLRDVEDALRALCHVRLYAECAWAVQTTDQVAAAQASRASALQAEVSAAIAFAEPELLAIGPATLLAWAKEEPRLAIYAHYFDALKHRAPHVRSSEVEQVLGQLLDPFEAAAHTHSVLADADLAFAPARSSADAAPMPLSQGNLDVLLASPDRETRRTAWESYADAHLAVKYTMANCLATGVKQHVFQARARRYATTLEAALEPNHLPIAVYRSVIEALERNYPLWHRYWRVLRRALGYDRLHVYDIKAPLTHSSPVIPFEQALDWICDGLAPLGEAYVETLRRGVLRQRWVDRYPNQGKTSGAFSSGAPGTHPFVLMSYTDDIYSLSTLAHELGHSLHSYLSWHTQPFVYADYSIFVAEVASNLNQAMVRDHLLAQVAANTLGASVSESREFEIALIEEAMSNFHRYFFVMPTLARFELEIHEREERGEGLTTDGLIALMADLFDQGYDGEVVMDRKRVGITWAQFHTHLYSNYYVYQYTTGIAGAHALLARMRAEGQPAVDQYLAFLSAGSSVYPLEALRAAGVDLTSPEPIQDAFDYMSALIDRLALLLGVSAA